MLFFRIKSEIEELPPFKIYKEKKVEHIAYPNCMNCKKKQRNLLIHMYKIGLENRYYHNLFLCRKCFKKLNGPQEKVVKLNASNK